MQLNEYAETELVSTFLDHPPNRPAFDETKKSICHDNFIEFIANSRCLTYYVMNCHHPSFVNKLEKFAINIHNDVNELNNAGLGVNISTFYLGDPQNYIVQNLKEADNEIQVLQSCMRALVSLHIFTPEMIRKSIWNFIER